MKSVKKLAWSATALKRQLPSSSMYLMTKPFFLICRSNRRSFSAHSSSVRFRPRWEYSSSAKSYHKSISIPKYKRAQLGCVTSFPVLLLFIQPSDLRTNSHS